eukprot:GFUD01018338.1.p1 GENE.GFUD01018338.1~~GFUD01018338.1.p1  ORF type:complete len:251 (-),score=18.61 GFUD01018338.1:52-741(-)
MVAIKENSFQYQYDHRYRDRPPASNYDWFSMGQGWDQPRVSPYYASYNQMQNQMDYYGYAHHSGKVQRQPVFTKYAFVDFSHGDGGTSGVTGRLTLAQGPGYVRIYGQIYDLPPGQHGFHVHQNGDTGSSCGDAGGHFNPDGHDHSAPGSALRHAGDLGNILTPGSSRVTQVDLTDRWITLGDGGFRDVAGRAIVVHADADDLGHGGDAGSITTGNAGARVACGVIRNY